MSIPDIVALTGAIMAIVFGLVALFRNKKTDDSADGKKDGVILTEIGYIKSGVDDMKRLQEQQNHVNVEFAQRLTAVEESDKSAHHRITRLENNLFTINPNATKGERYE